MNAIGINENTASKLHSWDNCDALNKFKNAMLDAGVTPPDKIIGDGNLHRFKIDGKLNGWYCLHLDDKAAGSFGDWKQSIKERWKLEGDFKPLTDAERKAFAIERKRQSEQRQAEEAAKHKAAAQKAHYIWNNATPAPANHPYLNKKHIGTHGARLGRDNTLIIPIYNAKQELVNLQFISESGGKRFLSGGQKKGCFYILDGDTGKVLIAEGFATAASLHESTCHLTVVAFDAGNLKEAAINIKHLYPGSENIICGDNDASGVGQRAALEAALVINGKYILPATVGHDWNDSLNMEVNHA